MVVWFWWESGRVIRVGEFGWESFEDESLVEDMVQVG